MASSSRSAKTKKAAVVLPETGSPSLPVEKSDDGSSHRMPKKKPGSKAGISASDRIPDRLRETIRQAIETHAGCEVLFVCEADENGAIVSLDDVAHGSPGSVPVPHHQVEPGQVVIHNHPSGRLIPSDADVQVASRLAEEGIGCWIVDNAAERLYIITDPYAPPPKVSIDLAGISAVLEPGGALSKRFNGYQARASQIAMLRLVSRSFNEDRVCVIEAGTGVGKTFAYLLPAAAWALDNKERIVISTATINLQQQIMDKDLPLVAKLIGRPLKAVLAKGRGNYVCVKRLGEALDEDSLLREEDGDLSRIAEWAKTTKDGSKSDLAFIPDDIVWSRINADADACSGANCALREQCFFFRARREAASAQIVVANHHLLFADAAMRAQGLGFDNNVVLPAFRRLVLDEAHNIENNAVDYFSQTLNKWSVTKYVNLLLRKRRGNSFGVLALLSQHTAGLGPSAIKALDTRLSAVREAMQIVDDRSLVLLSESGSLRLLPAMKADLVPLTDALSVLQRALLALVEDLGDLSKTIDNENEGGEVPGMVDLQSLTRRLSAVAATCETLRNYEAEQDRVIWAERRRLPTGEAFVHLIACPLDISPLLREAVFSPYPTVVMTSATLTVGRKFDWWARRLGLTGTAIPQSAGGTPASENEGWGGADEWDGYDSGARDPSYDELREAEPSLLPIDPESEETDFVDPLSEADRLSLAEELHLPFVDREMLRKQLPSPFDYAHRVLLAVPRDAPEPTGPDYQDYLNRFVARAIEISGGHALVLFTSYDMLLKTWEAVAPKLNDAGIPCYRQGEAERGKLLLKFNAEITSVLFATESFWEGVDSPGDTLQLLILCRLPFKVPTEPLQLARSEAIQARGGNPFMELSVPEAIMKFRQGFGRLMRRGEDFGVVLVPDKRIVTKSYGRLFLDSLPPVARTFGTSRQVMEATGEFLARWRDIRDSRP